MTALRILAVAGVILMTAVGLGAPRSEVVATQYFAFHSDPWINLHHFLYQWTRADLELATGRQLVRVPERSSVSLDPADAAVWEEALAYYREELAERSHFNREMLEFKAALLDMDGSPDAAPPGISDEHAAHLAAAMPVYQREWWGEHDAANRAWIESVVGRAREYEADWVSTVTRVFGGEWLGHLRVDASSYANWAGGYTSNRPDHAVLWSRDETNNRGLYGLELLFHESAHRRALESPSRSRIDRIFGEASLEVPDNLWHTLIFATAGRFTQGVSEREGLGDHVPYAVDQGLVGFRGWSALWPPVVEHWMPVVNGASDPDVAVRAIAEALGS